MTLPAEQTARQEPPGRALVLGFGPFGAIVDNPSARLAQAVHGRQTRHFSVVGHTMPVSYRRSVEVTAEQVARVRPAVVLGVGVAARRSHVALERRGHARWTAAPLDIDGRVPGWRPSPGVREARLPVDAMAEAGGIQVSTDCGSYVCNAWLYTVLGALPEHVQVGFLHVPPAGFDPDRLCAMLDQSATFGTTRV